MTNANQPIDLLREKVNLETARIPWKQLQRFFANGTAISVAPELDLVEVAHAFSTDQKNCVEQWLSDNRIVKVTDQQALQWFEDDLMVWAVIVKPWILIQVTNN